MLSEFSPHSFAWSSRLKKAGQNEHGKEATNSWSLVFSRLGPLPLTNFDYCYMIPNVVNQLKIVQSYRDRSMRFNACIERYLRKENAVIDKFELTFLGWHI